MSFLLGWLLVVPLSLAGALVVAELSYRFYVLDFYAPELRAFPSRDAHLACAGRPADNG
jgi:hypothetical protein